MTYPAFSLVSECRVINKIEDEPIERLPVGATRHTTANSYRQKCGAEIASMILTYGVSAQGIRGLNSYLVLGDSRLPVFSVAAQNNRQHTSDAQVETHALTREIPISRQSISSHFAEQ
ncbi:hypothetical protein V22_19610 [Calycomorphotria hydatis]|uniref:Uncharacterized protein n=1 Tax=Calycomorphotria hydatis TaxID=2528027 RepID=A0A517T8L4_9PLAN|nr:hypothetical protein V22_19610 [Calycomorphotria hydatis]